MAATVWKGHLTFGLVSIPVKLHRAARAEKVSFRQLHGTSAGRVKQVYVREPAEEAAYEPSDDSWKGDDVEPFNVQQTAPSSRPAAFQNSASGPALRTDPVPIRGTALPEVPAPAPTLPVINRSELVKGYEYSKGQFVTISKEDLQNITPQTAREMQIVEFVKLDEVDPIYFETSYYVTPDRGGERAYALLLAALRQSTYAAVAQFAMHNREHVVVIRPGRTGIVLHTMFYETEIRREDEYRADTSNVNERELKLALMLVESLAAEFDPSKYRDTYKENLDALIAAKIAGEDTVEAPEPKARPAADILAALERSLSLVRKPAASAAKTTAPAKRRKTR